MTDRQKVIKNTSHKLSCLSLWLFGVSTRYLVSVREYSSTWWRYVSSIDLQKRVLKIENGVAWGLRRSGIPFELTVEAPLPREMPISDDDREQEVLMVYEPPNCQFAMVRDSYEKASPEQRNEMRNEFRKYPNGELIMGQLDAQQLQWWWRRKQGSKDNWNGYGAY